MTRMFALVVCGLSFGCAFAHDLFIMPEKFRISPGETLTIAIHNGDQFPQSQSAPPMARLREAALHSPGKVTPVADLKLDGKRAVGTVAVVSPGYQILTIKVAENTENMEAGEFLDYLKEEGLSHVIDWRAKNSESDKKARERYSKYAKAIVLAGAPDAGFSRAAGLPIEIIPEQAPDAMKPGESLPVRVLFRGTPAANVQVIVASATGKPTPVGATAADGRISIRIPASGVYRLHALQMERCADPSAAEWESFWATLTFEVR